MLNSLILAAALFAAQDGYQMPSSSQPEIRPDRTPTPAPEATPAPQPTVATVPGKALSDLPNTTISYFDVSGKNMKAINKSIEQHKKIGASGRPGAAATGWSVDATISKVTANGQCKVANARAKFSAKVVLPRLVSDSAHPPQLLATWRAYVAGVENAQAASLWFVYDRVRDVENAILASSCEGAPAAGAAAVGRLRAQAAEFQRAKLPDAQASK